MGGVGGSNPLGLTKVRSGSAVWEYQGGSMFNVIGGILIGIVLVWLSIILAGWSYANVEDGEVIRLVPYIVRANKRGWKTFVLLLHRL